MADRPANAGSGRGLAPMGNTAPPLDAAAPQPFDAAPQPFDAAPPLFDAPPPFDAAPPPVHHDAPPATRSRANAPRANAPRAAAGHRAARSREPRPAADRNSARDRNGGLAWLPYLVVLAGVALGMFVAWQGSQYAGWGAALVGFSMLVAGLARLILPPRYAGLLSTRRKASDVLAFAVFGAAVLAVALTLP